MKKILFIIITVLVCSSANSQVGINTENPDQLLHIDPKGNTTSTSGKDDDVVVTNQGNVGIGTITPEDTLALHIKGAVEISDSLILKGISHIKEGVTIDRIGVQTKNPQALLHIDKTGNGVKFRLSDTSEREGYMLTSDSEGNAFWEALRPMASVVTGSFKAGVEVNRVISTNPVVREYRVNITEDSLKLVPGTWLIFANTSTRGYLNNFTMYMELYTDYGGTGDVSQSNKLLITTSSTAEHSDGSSNPAHLANPNLMFVVNVPVPRVGTIPLTPDDPRYITKLHIKLASSGTVSSSSTAKGAVSTGTGNFYALRVDRQKN